MKLTLALLLITFVCVVQSGGEKSSSLLGYINRCLSDKECKAYEFCDHHGINPFGTCNQGKELKQSCLFDRHCKSKHCHLMKCVARKPVRDGPCSPAAHDDCVQEQYCSHKESVYKCRDRLCSGYCVKDAHCITGKCKFFKCQKPEEGC